MIHTTGLVTFKGDGLKTGWATCKDIDTLPTGAVVELNEFGDRTTRTFFRVYYRNKKKQIIYLREVKQ